MFVRSPMTILFTSPRRTALYQIEQSRPIVTSPRITAVSARNVFSPITGVCPRTSLINAILSFLIKVRLQLRYMFVFSRCSRARIPHGGIPGTLFEEPGPAPEFPVRTEPPSIRPSEDFRFRMPHEPSTPPAWPAATAPPFRRASFRAAYALPKRLFPPCN